MKKIIKTLFLTSLGLGSITAFAQVQVPTVTVPPMVSVYAQNVVDIQLCKDFKIDIPAMNQKKVIEDYVKFTGSPNNFVSDVRQYTAFHMSLYKDLSKEKLMELCKDKRDVALEIAKILAPKKPKVSTNPLDSN